MRILIVDHDKEIRKTYGKMIMNAGFSAVSTETAEEALQLLEKEHFDLMIPEVRLPGMDGLALTKLLRSTGSNLPILITSSLHTHRDINAGLLCGADDYMAKPVEEEEFILRIKAILRRSHVNTSQIITIGSTVVDAHARVVTVGQDHFSLPHKEFDLLFFLLSYPNQVFSRDDLMNEIWGPDSNSEPATVSVHINRLRNFFSGNPDFVIRTCRGSGYKASTDPRIP